MKKKALHITTVFPILDALKSYNIGDFKGDVNAGITVGIMLIPQGMAYALIAGLPPQYGLYAALIPLLIYAVLGTSRHLGVGPVALIALLIASSVAPFANTPEEYIALSILLTLMVGGLQFIFGWLRMGFLVNMLSHPVLSGFISAAAIIIGLSQVHHLLGVDSVTGGLHDILGGIFSQFSEIHLLTLSIGIGAIGIIVLVKKWLPAIPGPVLAVIAGIILIYAAGFQNWGVTIVGEISKGLPAFIIPELEWQIILNLFPMAAAIALVAFMEAIAVAKAIQQKSKNYKIDPNQELVALGAANLGGAFFQSFPVTGSFSRTAINYESGAKTGIAGIISAGIVALSLLFLTPVFYYLPNAVLGAIIIVAVFGLIDYQEMKRLWKLGHYDRYMMLAAFAGTLFIGIKEGILLGVTLSVMMLLYRSARPNHAVIGRIPGTSVYRNVERYETEHHPDTLIFRFDAPLHFANAEYFRQQVNELISKHPGTTCLILDLNGVNEIDSTGLDELAETINDVNEKKVSVKLTEVKAPVRDMLKRGSQKNDEWAFYMRIEDAIHSLSEEHTTDTPEKYSIHLDTK